jgi:hypothetical protein
MISFILVNKMEHGWQKLNAHQAVFKTGLKVSADTATPSRFSMAWV